MKLPPAVSILLCACALAVTACPRAARAQDSPSSSWLTLGTGLGSGGAGVSGSMSLKLGSHVASLRVAGTGRQLGGDLWDVGVLYGQAACGERYLLSVSGGVAMAGGHRKVDASTPREVIPAGFGVPVEAQGFVRPFPWGGLGLYAYAELSSRATFAGASLAVQLGSVK